MSSSPWRASLAFVAALLAVAVLLIRRRLSAGAPQYIAIVDAGSSGSRLLVYSRRGEQLEQLEQLCMHTVEPGLGSFVHSPEGASHSILRLISEAEACVHPIGLPASSIPLYLFATGGLRSLLPEERSVLLQSVFSRVREQSSVFRLSEDESGMLAGDRESEFGWLAVNHLSAPSHAGQTVGSIDLGGASFEIAFLSSESHTLVTRSFSSLGADQLRVLLLQHLPDHRHPCYPTGYEEEYNGQRFVGMGDAAECSALVESVIEDRSSCSADFCDYQALRIPQMNMTFFGMSLLFYASDYCAFVRSTLFHQGPASVDGTEFDADASSRCWRTIAPVSMQDLEQKIGSSHAFTGRKLLPYRLLQGVWIDAMLRRISDSSSGMRNRVVLVKNVGNKNVDWSLGAALYYSG